MDKMIISVFDDEKQAYEGSRAIQELHREGSIKRLRAEIKGARDDAAAKIQARIDRDKAKLEDLGNRASAEVDRLQGEAQAKVETIQTQIKTASAESKAKFDEHLTALRADYERRTDKLAQAGRLAREALSA